jgi:multicomponent Na+:H+ antiporter subunit B
MSAKLAATKKISKFYFAFSLLFGLYLMTHGHISHGAGIAGGVIIFLGFLQAFLITGADTLEKVINKDNARLTAVSGISAVLLLAILGYINGTGLMSNILPAGRPFELLSGGVSVLYNIAFCVSVFGCLWLMFLGIFGAHNKD